VFIGWVTIKLSIDLSTPNRQDMLKNKAQTNQYRNPWLQPPHDKFRSCISRKGKPAFYLIDEKNHLARVQYVRPCLVYVFFDHFVFCSYSLPICVHCGWKFV
jgi:hypothetical protein